ncbi:MAG: DivIVA domain-containing protein [Rhodothermales bacterium]|nr:DivIVA domain-containing protein [Rhodothermales bacterium]
MKLTALDIRKQEFSRTLRGYDPDEVDSFIEVVSDQWKEMVDELKRDNDRISELELKLEHYHKVEEALEEALQTARTSARQTIVQADVKARKIIEAAEEDAEKITRDARDHRREIKREAAKFSVRRKEIVAKLRAFLLSEMEMLAHYDDDDPTGFLRLLGDAAGQQGGQAQLAAGNPDADSLADDDAEAEDDRRRPAAASSDTEQARQPDADDFEEEYPAAYLEDYPEEAAESAASIDEAPEYDGHASQAEEDERPQPEPQPVADASEQDAPEEIDGNDSFQSEYMRMATLDEIYGQFDPDAADDQTDAAPEAAYDEDAYEDFIDEGYVDQVNGTGDGVSEYPRQTRPAEDRPPADSPAASGRRAPGMRRPEERQELSESASEDIEKIRRILDDLDN